MPSSDPPTILEPRLSDTLVSPPPLAQGNDAAANPIKIQISVASPEEKKPSGADLKKRAKEEKAARRAQALAEKQGVTPAPSATTSQAPGSQQKFEQKGVKGQPRRLGSTAVEHKNMPVRGAPKVAPVPVEPKKEDKTVEFFRHLYRTRTTSIAGANKDVHPAVLALGLQMSNYTICGSCARLVATLQAFKRVSRILLFVASLC